jgi:hypothetical protein
MPPPTPQQQLRRRRFETLIAVAAPVLDLVLATGDRVSKVAGAEDDYYPIRAPGDAFSLESGRASQSAEGGRASQSDDDGRGGSA